MTKVFNVTLQHYDYKGDARSPTWNEAETWLIEGTESEIADFCHEQNVRIINDAHKLAEETIAQYTAYIDLEKKRIAVWESLTDEQKEVLGHRPERTNAITSWENIISDCKSTMNRLATWEMKTIHDHGTVSYRWVFSETLVWDTPALKEYIKAM